VSVNEFLDSSWDELVSRMALGIEPTDPLFGSRIGQRVQVALDGIPWLTPPHLRDHAAPPWELQTVLETVARRDTCRHVLVAGPEVEDPVDLRFQDPTQRYVPRRLRIRLPAPIGSGRQIRPALFPGAAYGPPAGSMGLRGRILRGGAPMRWARVEARRVVDDLLVGVAHGDEHGEFLLVLDPAASRGADLILPIEVTVTVFGPDVAPDPAAVADADADPLWDLPLEEADLTVAADGVLAGRTLPPGYASRPNSIRDVQFSWNGLVREQFDFS
jgi:hypothetical protein